MKKIVLKSMIISILFTTDSCTNSSKKFEQNDWDQITKNVSDFQDALYTQAITQFNQSLPSMIDNITRLDHVSYSSGVIKYESTFLNVATETVTALDFKQRLLKQIIYGINQEPKLKIFRVGKKEFNFSYKDASGNELFELLISPEMY